MDIASLQAFVAVAVNGSFSAASDQLHVTQPAISKRIASLELDLSNRLFDRLGRHISLTEAGKALLPRAQRILLEIDDSRRALRDLSGQISGPLHIATSHHIGLHRLPPLLRRYTRRYPDVELDIQFMDSEQACQAVAHGRLEMAIVTLPLQPAEELNLQTIWPDPMSIVIGKTHPLAGQTRYDLEQLIEHKAILPAHGTFTREIIERAFLDLQRPIKISLVTNYLETIKMMVSIGLGWSVLPEAMLSHDIQPLRIRHLQIQRQLGLVWHSNRSVSNAARALQSLLIDESKSRL